MLQWPENKTNGQQWQQLNVLLDQLDPDQKLWLSGFLAASARVTNTGTTPVITSEKGANKDKLTILFGSQTGNGESVAKNLQSQAEALGLATELFSLADITAKQLAKKTHITLVISTHGEGEAPDDAEQFYEQIFSNKAPDLSAIKYSVLALGDSSYELYCQTGKEIDQRLSELGATQIHERIDCDVDFEEPANQWITGLLPKIESELKQENPDANNITALPLHGLADAPGSTLASKQKPSLAEILTIQKITGRGSDKNTFHLELAIDPNVIQYKPGDSLGVWAHNGDESVEQLLQHWGLEGDEELSFKNHNEKAKKLLTEHIEITQISKPFVQYLATQINNTELQAMADSHQAYTDYCQDHQLLDLLLTFDPERKVSIQDSLLNLKSITPRLYSIASAQSIEEDELHLTINLEEATALGHYGLASGLLCHGAQVGDQVSVYVEPNANFRLPDDPETPIIMIGPGTGIAPFRSFLQQRQHQQANGKNWLVFGNPHFSTDFLYQTEWLKLQKSGFLQQLDVAFSRDQDHKVYVQDKLKSKASELWHWLEQGAHIYLCGDATRMAKDVENTLLEIISTQGSLSAEEAKHHLKILKRNNRYQKDVY